jgi:methylmalonyl-CoA mutase cobalamin-binding domain/chain
MLTAPAPPADLPSDFLRVCADLEPLDPSPFVPPTSGAPAPASFPAFDPDPACLPALLDALADPSRSLASIADEYGTSLLALSLWMARDDVRTLLAALEAASARRARLIATGFLRAAADVLSASVESQRRELESLEARDLAASPALLARRNAARETARRTTHLLLRIASVVPLQVHKHRTENARARSALPLAIADTGAKECVTPPSPAQSPSASELQHVHNSGGLQDDAIDRQSGTSKHLHRLDTPADGGPVTLGSIEGIFADDGDQVRVAADASPSLDDHANRDALRLLRDVNHLSLPTAGRCPESDDLLRGSDSVGLLAVHRNGSHDTLGSGVIGEQLRVAGGCAPVDGRGLPRVQKGNTAGTCEKERDTRQHEEDEEHQVLEHVNQPTRTPERTQPSSGALLRREWPQTEAPRENRVPEIDDGCYADGQEKLEHIARQPDTQCVADRCDGGTGVREEHAKQVERQEGDDDRVDELRYEGRTRGTEPDEPTSCQLLENPEEEYVRQLPDEVGAQRRDEHDLGRAEHGVERLPGDVVRRVEMGHPLGEDHDTENQRRHDEADVRDAPGAALAVVVVDDVRQDECHREREHAAGVLDSGDRSIGPRDGKGERQRDAKELDPDHVRDVEARDEQAGEPDVDLLRGRELVHEASVPEPDPPTPSKSRGAGRVKVVESLLMTTTLPGATTEFEKKDRCADLPHRPRVLLGKMGLDGHDRGVKVIARALRDSGFHVIYSGLWQTPRSLAIAARDEDCDALCASMMSNSHLVLAPRLVEELKKLGRPDIPVYMGGILPQEDIPKLLEGGIARCFTTGVGLLEIVDALKQAVRGRSLRVPSNSPASQLARDISLLHAGRTIRPDARRRRPARVIGVTGAPGAGKSTLVAQMVAEYARNAPDSSAGHARAQPAATARRRCAVVAFDPMSPISGGALLGDRLRVDFNTLDESVYYRSLAIGGEDYHALPEIIELIGGAFENDEAVDLLFIETVGAGQNETRIRQYVDRTAVVLTPGMGDAVQMDKAGILEIADVFVCNKADHPGEHELLRDLRDVAGRRPILETIATRAQGVPELLAALMA